MDAAIAAAFADAVMQPASSGIGGGGATIVAQGARRCTTTTARSSTPPGWYPRTGSACRASSPGSRSCTRSTGCCRGRT
ncbi:MAG: gamma-glutamyltransferase [Microbacteriaceae bacterium]